MFWLRNKKVLFLLRTLKLKACEMSYTAMKHSAYLEIFHAFLSSAAFFKNYFFEKFVQEYH